MAFSSKSLKIGRHIRHVGRLVQITNIFARHGLFSLLERLNIKSWLTPEQVRRARAISVEEGDSAGGQEAKGLPARLRRSFEELGPAFVKLGQVLATREDLLPREYIEELRKLHMKVAPVSFEELRSVIETDLGSLKKHFKNFDQTPLAAGSIAQVHRATLHTGEQVVVKIQRPGIAQSIAVDLTLMEELAGLVEKYIPELQSTRPRAMIDEFSRGITGELDFIREAGNIAKFTKNFADVSEIVIPEVHWSVTTGRVLTMQELTGIPAWEKDRMIAQGISPTKLVESGLGMFLKMVFVDGLYHGDLHPGNLLGMTGDRVGVLDFGLAVHLGRSTQESLAGLLVALVNEDFSRVVMHYVEMADPAMNFDVDAFERDIRNSVAPFIGLSLESLRTGRLFWDLARVAAKHGAPMPQELAIFTKTLASFEGIGTHLDPSFDILKTSEQFTTGIAKELYSVENLKRQGLIVARDVGQLGKHAPFQLRRLLRATLEGDLQLRVVSSDLARLGRSLDRSGSRLAISIIIAALIVGSSILAVSKVGEDLSSIPLFGLVGFTLAGLLGIYVVVSVLWGGKF